MSAERRGERMVSLGEYERMPEEDLYRLELVAGMIVREPRPMPIHGRIVVRMGYFLEVYAQKTGTGVVLSESGFVLEEDPPTVRGPDVSFVSNGRIPAAAYASGFWHMAPDLAIEVLSPSNRARQLGEKIADYFAAGTRAAWVIDPHRRTVAVHRPGGGARIVAGDGVLEDPDILPGFSLPLAELFRL